MYTFNKKSGMTWVSVYDMCSEILTALNPICHNMGMLRAYLMSLYPSIDNMILEMLWYIQGIIFWNGLRIIDSMQSH